MNQDLDRLCSAAQGPAYAYAMKVTAPGAVVDGREVEEIVRAVLKELESMAVEQEEKGTSIKVQEMGRYAGMFARRVLG